MNPRTVSARVLETMVPDSTWIEFPGPEGGWATAVINGREYRARVAPVLTCGATVSGNSDDDIYACVHPATHVWLDLTGQWTPVCEAHGPGRGIPADRLRRVAPAAVAERGEES